ncbi:hypothetical protein HPP92_015851 [Vanilla planifolia]|uniref:Inhibitor I9 domain-containing protein n=1 Tax=Vanilla planifolia TaxID=51239 RepID=A0A835USE9_VANPL|nr:hypothetical protein HPP92_015851 [Vanilla planifolia]
MALSQKRSIGSICQLKHVDNVSGGFDGLFDHINPSFGLRSLICNPLWLFLLARDSYADTLFVVVDFFLLKYASEDTFVDYVRILLLLYNFFVLLLQHFIDQNSSVATSSESVMSYSYHLEKMYDELLDSLFEASSYKKIYSYGHLINGFSVHLSPDQAEALSKAPE